MSGVLVTWVAATDYRAMRGEAYVGLGPVAQALRARSFSQCVLLNNYSPMQGNQYLAWVQPQTATPVELRQVDLDSPVNYAEIYAAVVAALESISSQHPRQALTFHLSPGTPTMTAIWVLLSQTRFPAGLIQSSRQRGVEDVALPFDIAVDYLPEVLAQQDRLLSERAAESAPLSAAFESIVHRSPAMVAALAQARRAARRNVPVLIEGESGTGKELLARAIHAESSRREQPFVAVNCGAIPPELLESELFGHTRGAFTGAAKARPGHFRAAHGGTLLLDEIGELPLAAQVKILRVLQEQEVTPVGGSQPVPVSVRILAATHQNLMEACQEGRFRYDLFYRLAVAIIPLPPLRQRQGDLHLLVEHTMADLAEEATALGEPAPRLTAGALRVLQSHDWPGNVRELRNTLRRAALWGEEEITAEEMQRALLRRPPVSGGVLNRPLDEDLVLPDLLAEVARHYLSRAMAEAGGNKTEAARLVGLPSYQTLTNWLKKYKV